MKKNKKKSIFLKRFFAIFIVIVMMFSYIISIMNGLN